MANQMRQSRTTNCMREWELERARLREMERIGDSDNQQDEERQVPANFRDSGSMLHLYRTHLVRSSSCDLVNRICCVVTVDSRCAAFTCKVRRPVCAFSVRETVPANQGVNAATYSRTTQAQRPCATTMTQPQILRCRCRCAFVPQGLHAATTQPQSPCTTTMTRAHTPHPQRLTGPLRDDDDAGTQPTLSSLHKGSTELPRGDNVTTEPVRDNEKVGAVPPRSDDAYRSEERRRR